MQEDRLQKVLEQNIKPNLLKLVTDPNANHVLQKVINQMSNKDLGFLLEFFNENADSFCNNPFACRVMQRLIEKVP